jgi:hypothetical protein
MSEINPAKPFCRMKRLCVQVFTINWGFIIESSGVHDERIAFPFSD